MKKILLTMTALSALIAAAPAAAQYSTTNDYRMGSIESRLDRLRLRIDEGVRRGTISRSEAGRLQGQLWRLRQLENQYDGNGFTAWERNELERRFAALRDQLQSAEGPARGGMYDRDDDRWDRATPDGSWNDDDMYDRDSDGWDDRDRDRDGGWRDDQPGSYDDRDDDDGRYGDDDRYDDDDDRPGSFDSDGDYYDNGAPVGPGDDDRWDDDDVGTGYPGAAIGLRVGARAPENLGAVPPEYRSRYRDGSGVYYRYDDGRVYQIDSRTRLIRWIGELPY